MAVHEVNVVEDILTLVVSLMLARIAAPFPFWRAMLVKVHPVISRLALFSISTIGTSVLA